MVTNMQAIMKSLPSQNGKRKSGFTLIELMVVIAILLILAVITLAVSSNVKQRAQINKTKFTLNILQGILNEYERDTGTVFNITENDTTLYVTTLKNYPKTKDSIAKMLAENGNEVNDGFGRPIQIITNPKRGFMSTGPSGPGGSDPIYSWDAQ